MEYRELAEKSGITHWRRVPALNTDERFIADMADMVVSYHVYFSLSARVSLSLSLSVSLSHIHIHITQ